MVIFYIGQMDTIYVVIRYRDIAGSTEYRLSRAFTHHDQAMRFISAMGIDPNIRGIHQSAPRGSIYDASVLGQGNIRVALIPIRLTVGTTQEITTDTTSVVQEQTVAQPPLSLGREPLYIRDVGDFWYVSGGNSYIRRNRLKDLGGRWNPNAKIWIIPKVNTTEATLRTFLQ